MAVNRTDTWTLIQKIEETKNPQPYYLNKYFGTTMLFDTEQIDFDEVTDEREIAPFVSPEVEGKVVRTRGHATKSFRPAYVKPKHIVKPSQALKRLPGEPYGGSMSPAQRLEAATAENFRKEASMIDNRMEWMAVQALKSGAVTISGDDYPTRNVDFGRDAALSITLAGAARWNDSAPDVVGDIENLSTLMSKADFGAPAIDVYLDPDGWKAIRGNADLKDLIDTRFVRQNTSMERGPTTFNPEQEPQLVAQIENFNIWVDSRQYTNEAGTVVPVLASGDALFLSNQVRGVQAYGAIQDVDVMIATRIYPKVWQKEDPSARFTMTQSAPLVIPVRVNASGYMKVL